MPTNKIDGDMYVNGAFSSKTFVPPDGSIDDDAIEAFAEIDATKLDHQHQKGYAQESATNAASETRLLHVVRGATATVVDFGAGAVVPLTGDDTCTVNLKKNGSSILSAAISLASSDVARALKTGTVSSPNLVQGDVLEVTITPTHNTGALPKGVYCNVTIREKAQ